MSDMETVAAGGAAMDVAAPGGGGAALDGCMVNPVFDLWGGSAGQWGELASQQRPAAAEVSWEGQLLQPSGKGGLSSSGSPVTRGGGVAGSARVQFKATVAEGATVLVEPLSGGC